MANKSEEKLKEEKLKNLIPSASYSSYWRRHFSAIRFFLSILTIFFLLCIMFSVFIQPDFGRVESIKANSYSRVNPLFYKELSLITKEFQNESQVLLIQLVVQVYL